MKFSGVLVESETCLNSSIGQTVPQGKVRGEGRKKWHHCLCKSVALLTHQELLHDLFTLLDISYPQSLPEHMVERIQLRLLGLTLPPPFPLKLCQNSTLVFLMECLGRKNKVSRRCKDK